MKKIMTKQTILSLGNRPFPKQLGETLSFFTERPILFLDIEFHPQTKEIVEFYGRVWENGVTREEVHVMIQCTNLPPSFFQYTTLKRSEIAQGQQANKAHRRLRRFFKRYPNAVLVTWGLEDIWSLFVSLGRDWTQKCMDLQQIFMKKEGLNTCPSMMMAYQKSQQLNNEQTSCLWVTPHCAPHDTWMLEFVFQYCEPFLQVNEPYVSKWIWDVKNVIKIMEHRMHIKNEYKNKTRNLKKSPPFSLLQTCNLWERWMEKNPIMEHEHQETAHMLKWFGQQQTKFLKNPSLQQWHNYKKMYAIVFGMRYEQKEQGKDHWIETTPYLHCKQLGKQLQNDGDCYLKWARFVKQQFKLRKKNWDAICEETEIILQRCIQIQEHIARLNEKLHLSSEIQNINK